MDGGNAVGGIYNASGAVLTLQDTFISGSATGGDGGNGGAGGAGGAGGDAVGGVLNEGTINAIGAAILHDDSATAGTGGVSGRSEGGDGGGGGRHPPGSRAKDGGDDAVVAPSLNGLANVDSLNNGMIAGNLAVDKASVSIANAIGGATVVEDGSALVARLSIGPFLTRTARSQGRSIGRSFPERPGRRGATSSMSPGEL